MTPADVLTRPIRVVIADDTPDVRLLLRLGLQATKQFQVVAEAADGQEAVDAVLEHHPDVLLLDLAMPVMDGLEAIIVLRDRAPDCGIVVLSGFDANRMADQVLREGADAYLTKGTRPDEIAATLRQVVESRGMLLVPEHEPPEGDPRLAHAAVPAVTEAKSIEVAYRRGKDLLPMLAHELLNSITVIEGYATTLANAADNGAIELARECATVIRRQSEQMEQLVKSSQDARQMEIGTLQLSTSPMDMAAATREAIGDLSNVLANHVVAVDDLEPTPVLADPVRLRQIIMNLLSNAAKFSPHGSRIAVEVRRERGQAVLRVSDEGLGVPPDRRHDIFDKFERLDARVPGSGLGLYVARGLARAHGGELAVEDSVVGATFALTLPLHTS